MASDDHHRDRYDPWRLQPQGRPAPVDGPLPPAICLVDEDGPFPPRHPLWLRLAAAGMALGFFVATALTAFATAGVYSPLTDAGNWRLFGAASAR